MRCLAALLCLLACLAPCRAETLVTIDPASPAAYRFEGWGTSLCWWAVRVGDWPEERLDPLMDAIADPVDGLGLTVFRYNLGGGENPAHDHMRPGAEVPGFRAGPGEPLDPEADPAQRRVLLKLLERADEPIVEAFANSPPWWMTKSGCAAGGEGGESNLPDDRIDDFAAYLADVTRLYRDRYGVTFRTLEPFNEPNQTWWDAGGNQEGCYIPQRQHAAVIQAVHAALVERGLADQVAVAATDAHDLDQALEDLRRLDPAALEHVGQINAHSYRGSRRHELRELAASTGKRLWQSESGPMGLDRDAPDPLLAMQARVALALNELRAAAWVMWQVADPSWLWCCLRVDHEAETFRPNPNFGLYRQFTRPIRPGDRIVPTADPRVVAATSGDGRLAVVVVNATESPATHTLRLADPPPAGAELGCTRSGRRERCEPTPEAARRDGDRLTIEAAPLTVTTVTLTPG